MRYTCVVITCVIMACNTPNTDMRKADSGTAKTTTDASGGVASDTAGSVSGSDDALQSPAPDSNTPMSDTQTPLMDGGGGTSGTDGSDGTDGSSGNSGTDATDGTTGTSSPTLIEQSCEKDVECGFAESLNQCVTALQQLKNSGPPACKSELQSLLQCKVGTANPCQSPELSECAPLYQSFDQACFGGGNTKEIAKQWKKICALFGQTAPENCPPEVDLNSVVDLCEFVADVLTDTPECLVKVNDYLECAPKMTFHCEEGQLIPVPKQPNPCDVKAIPFAFPEGECVGG